MSLMKTVLCRIINHSRVPDSGHPHNHRSSIYSTLSPPPSKTSFSPRFALSFSLSFARPTPLKSFIPLCLRAPVTFSSRQYDISLLSGALRRVTLWSYEYKIQSIWRPKIEHARKATQTKATAIRSIAIRNVYIQ